MKTKLPGQLEILKKFRWMRTKKKSILEVVEMYFKDYGDLVELHLFGKTIFLVSNPLHVRQVLQERNTKYVKGPSYEFLRMILGNGLLTSEGSSWMANRRSIQPSFSRHSVSQFESIIHGCADRLVTQWKEAASGGIELDLSREMNRVTLSVVSLCLFSTDLSREATPLYDALTVALAEVELRSLTFFHPPVWWPTPRMSRFRKALSTMNRIVYGMIRERRQSTTPPGDLLTMLIQTRDPETGHAFNDEQIRDEVMTFLLAGHETTANALGWTPYLLAEHPEIEKKLRLDLSDESGENGFATSPYLDACISESMRLYPPAPSLERINVGEDAFGDRRIPPGSIVSLMTYNAHRHGDYHPDPDQFKPERFLTGSINREYYFPFGAGNRMCIGAGFAMTESRIILAKIMKNFQIELSPNQQIVPEMAVTLRPVNGIRAKIKSVR